MPRLVALLAALLLVATACTPDTETDVQAEAVLRELQQCENPDAGYTLEYPESWNANQPGAALPCSIFDDGDIRLVNGQALDPANDVVIRVLPEEFDLRVETEGYEIASVAPVTVGERGARRLYAVATEENAQFPAGTVTYQYVVAHDAGTLVASANDLGGPAFAVKRQVLDRMMATLRFHQPPEPSPRPPDVPQSPLPPVEDV